MRTRRLFLTYPQVPAYNVDYFTEKFLEHIRLMPFHESSSPFKYVVARELHKDLGIHFHVFLEYAVPVQITSNRSFDILDSHPNIQSVRSAANVVKYVTKDDEFKTNFSDEEMKSLIAASGKRSALAMASLRIVKNPDALTKLALEFPEVYVRHHRGLKALQTLVYANKSQTCRFKHDIVGFWDYWTPVPVITTTQLLYCMTGGSDATNQIIAWIKTSLVPPFDLPHRAPHLYIYGPTCTGKTTLTKVFRDFFSCFEIPFHLNGFFDGFDDEAFDVAIWEDFGPGMLYTLGFMKRWFEGIPVPLNVKGSSTTKRRNLPQILTSNYSVEELYHKKTHRDLEPLLSRLTIVSIEKVDDLRALARSLREFLSLLRPSSPTLLSSI